MPRIIILFFLLSCILFSCKKNKVQEFEEYPVGTNQLKTLKANKRIVQLNPKSENLVKSWPEYQKFNEFITPYQEISMSDALLNSKELSELAQQLKDSVRVERLAIPEVKTRLNVLHSECLRLADMATIPTITETEVSEENNNVIDAFSALNLKINNMNSKEALNNEIEKFIDEVTLEIDSFLNNKDKKLRKIPAEIQ